MTCTLQGHPQTGPKVGTLFGSDVRVRMCASHRLRVQGSGHRPSFTRASRTTLRLKRSPSGNGYFARSPRPRDSRNLLTRGLRFRARIPNTSHETSSYFDGIGLLDNPIIVISIYFPLCPYNPENSPI